MSREIRSRRVAPVPTQRRPIYARVLGLQYVNPSSLLCFVYFEGTIALAILLTLAEQTSPWAVAVLPIAVAVMVKTNDVIAGALIRSGGEAAQTPRQRSGAPAAAAPAVGRAAVPATRATSP